MLPLYNIFRRHYFKNYTFKWHAFKTSPHSRLEGTFGDIGHSLQWIDLAITFNLKGLRPSTRFGYCPIWTRCCETLRGLFGCRSCDGGLVVPFHSHEVGWPEAPCSHSAIMLSNFNTRDLFNHFFCETAKGNPGLWWVEHSVMWGQRELVWWKSIFISPISCFYPSIFLWIYFLSGCFFLSFCLPPLAVTVVLSGTQTQDSMYVYASEVAIGGIGRGCCCWLLWMEVV